MGMKGENVIQKSKGYLVKKPTTVNNTTVDGDAINEPWKHGRRLKFHVAADIPAASALTVKLIGKKRSDSAWELVLDKAGAEIVLAASKLADGGTLETAGLRAELDLSRFKAETYSDVTLRFINGAATAVVVAATAEVHDLYSVPTSEADEFSAAVLQ